MNSSTSKNIKSSGKLTQTCPALAIKTATILEIVRSKSKEEK